MSGTKGTAQRSCGEISLDEYRAAQREAARVEQERRAREQQRRLAAAQALALAVARERFAATQRSYFELVSRVDDARRRMPDLACPSFAPPALPASDDVSAWTSCVASMEVGLSAWRTQVDDAIRHAEMLQRRREALRAAWARHHELGELCAAVAQDLAAVSSTHGEPAPPWFAPAPPLASADAQAVERANAVLESLAARMGGQIERYRAMSEANDALRSAIERVALRQSLMSAEAAVSQWKLASQSARARAFEDKLRENLRTLGVKEVDLPARLRAALTDVRLGHETPEGAGLWVGIERHVEQVRQRECAAALLDNPPFIEDDDLADAWRSVACDFERVVNGLAELTPTMARTCEALHSEAKLRMSSRYTRAAIMLALEECGFVPVERDDVQFDEANGERTVLGLQGYPEHRVLLDTRGDGLLWMPFRTDDAADVASRVRDGEFDDAACARLHKSLRSINKAGRAVVGDVIPLAKPGERQIQRASDMTRLGVRVAEQDRTRESLKQRFRDPPGR
jgi:hypothetical protein